MAYGPLRGTQAEQKGPQLAKRDQIGRSSPRCAGRVLPRI